MTMIAKRVEDEIIEGKGNQELRFQSIGRIIFLDIEVTNIFTRNCFGQLENDPKVKIFQDQSRKKSDKWKSEMQNQIEIKDNGAQSLLF